MSSKKSLGYVKGTDTNSLINGTSRIAPGVAFSLMGNVWVDISENRGHLINNSPSLSVGDTTITKEMRTKSIPLSLHTMIISLQSC
jgi:hypothetical protein